MTYLAIGIGVLIAGLGALGVASPERLIAILRRYETPGGLRVSAVVRVVLGVALFLAAPTSKAPLLTAASVPGYRATTVSNAPKKRNLSGAR